MAQVKIINSEGMARFAPEGEELAEGETVELELSDEELRDAVAAGWVESAGKAKK
jgi:hypothetical protein